MPLTVAADICDLLRCPGCASELVLEPEPRCANADCIHNRQAFPRSAGQPVLIEFERSIFSPEDFTTPTTAQFKPVHEGSRIGRFLDRLTYGQNDAATQNLSRFVGLLPASPLVLVIGGGSRGNGTSPLYESAATIVGTDIYASSNTALVCDGHQLPFADESFDGVLIQAVLEHVLDPALVVMEIHRVLKPGGLIYAETPFMQQVHEGAYDFMRFTHSGHRWLFRRFDQIDAGMVSGPANGLLWAISYFVRALGGGSRRRALATASFFWVRYLEKLSRQPLAMDAAGGVFFLGTRSERELRPRDMIKYYDQR